MNYFAHGYRFLDQPYVLVGTALPDWLSVADRGVRLRPRYVEPFRDHDDPIVSQIATGVLRHFDDDDAFHRSATFYEVSGELTRLVREALNDADGYRFSFLGHILTELLLDAALIEERPEELDEYYRVVETLDSLQIQQSVNRMARRETQRLATFIDIFAREQFLRDYLDDALLLFRLNQVMRRVTLQSLPAAFIEAIQQGRQIVRQRLIELLPASL